MAKKHKYSICHFFCTLAKILHNPGLQGLQNIPSLGTCADHLVGELVLLHGGAAVAGGLEGEHEGPEDVAE